MKSAYFWSLWMSSYKNEVNVGCPGEISLSLGGHMSSRIWPVKFCYPICLKLGGIFSRSPWYQQFSVVKHTAVEVIKMRHPCPAHVTNSYKGELCTIYYSSLSSAPCVQNLLTHLWMLLWFFLTSEGKGRKKNKFVWVFFLLVYLIPAAEFSK